MTREEIKERQRKERTQCLQKILDSKATKKLILSGAGTGKTYTFREQLKLSVGGNNLTMTFIRKLVADMEVSLGTVSEVKTLHKYCKKILHEQNGRVELVPFLTKIIESDANLLGETLADFDTKIRMLEETSGELAFYLRRGDYYEVVGFDDSVYRLYSSLRKDPSVLPSFDQILIDEFQDFNPLEVAFIHELAKKGNILIVGDDDQAIYTGRSASPSHLRELYEGGTFEKFELPFCSRCPEVIVAATNSIIENAERTGHFAGRIPKRYVCYLDDKEADSLRYPKIILAICTTAKVVAKYVETEISKIGPDDIEESHNEGYPTVLVVGTRQYQREIEKQLLKTHIQLSYSPSSESDFGPVEGYELLMRNERSNLGWRTIAEIFSDAETLKDVVVKSTGGIAFIDLLDPSFVKGHLRALDLLRTAYDGTTLSTKQKADLGLILGLHSDDVLTRFSPPAIIAKTAIDTSKPTILLTSFMGCKGLSAGHVLIVGAHDGGIPRIPARIKDVEISQFIVALTRTKKQCHIVSNKWLIAPVAKGVYVRPYVMSRLVRWIPAELIEDRGTLKAADLK